MNENLSKITEKYTDLVENGYTMEQIILNFNTSEEFVINFLSDNFKNAKVSQFLTSYYDKFNIDDNKVIVISDTHLGSEEGSYYLLNSVYDYALQNKIKYIIHAGDIIEGYVNFQKKCPPVETQLEQLEKNYPRVDEIKTYYIMGNHDYFFSYDYKRNKSYDYNLVRQYLSGIKNLECIGVLKSYVNFLNSYRIEILHSKDYYYVRHPNLECDLTLKGHGHKFYFDEGNRIIGLPSLCRTGIDNTNVGFIVMELMKDLYKFEYLYLVKNDKCIHVEKTLECKKKILK